MLYVERRCSTVQAIPARGTSCFALVASGHETSCYSMYGTVALSHIAKQLRIFAEQILTVEKGKNPY